ncbi:MAG: DUF4136 domain-containing protein [Deltaproteobacteria bacterium]|nr:DUF4136 domain-containing protein [Deltaproteobacteria bacterium]
MRTTATRAGALSLAILFVACAPRIKVATDYNPQANFARLHTFSWLPRAQPKSGNLRLDSGLVEGRVRRAVNKTLTAKGFREVAATSEPDFFVAYQAAVQNKIDVHSTPTYYGYRGWWRGPAVMGTQTSVHQYDLGTLLIDVVDRERDDLIWRGSGQAKLSPRDSGSPAEKQERMDAVVEQILEDFPPTS